MRSCRADTAAQARLSVPCHQARLREAAPHPRRFPARAPPVPYTSAGALFDSHTPGDRGCPCGQSTSASSLSHGRMKPDRLPCPRTPDRHTRQRTARQQELERGVAGPLCALTPRLLLRPLPGAHDQAIRMPLAAVCPLFRKVRAAQWGLCPKICVCADLISESAKLSVVSV